MAKLPAPYDVLDLLDGEELVTRVTGMAEGEIAITVRRTGVAKTVAGLRIVVPAADKPTVPYYWDLTATTLLAHMRPLLPAAIQSGAYIKIHKFGVAPQARFTFAVLPAGYTGGAHIGAHQ